MDRSGKIIWLSEDQIRMINVQSQVVSQIKYLTCFFSKTRRQV